MWAHIVLIAGLMTFGAVAQADPALGLWRTEPDRKNLVSHINIRTCGAVLCGRIVKAFNAQGAEVRTPNVGRELFWDL